MATLSPTEVLEHEHHSIQQVVAGMAILVEDLQKGVKVPGEILRDLVEFLRTFADRCHHGKEETCLFPKLESKGIPPRGCPLGALKAEHEAGRKLVSQLAEVSKSYIEDGSESETLSSTLTSLVELYKGHIWKEDYLLFPMTQKVLSSAEQAELSAQFADVESRIGTDVHVAFEGFAEQLKDRILRP